MPRIALMIWGFLNLLLGAGIAVVLEGQIAAAKMHTLSAYRELDVAGVIDHTKLNQHANGRFRGDWTLAPRFLSERLDSVSMVTWLVIGFSFFNCSFIVWLLASGRQQRELPLDGEKSGRS